MKGKRLVDSLAKELNAQLKLQSSPIVSRVANDPNDPIPTYRVEVFMNTTSTRARSAQTRIGRLLDRDSRVKKANHFLFCLADEGWPRYRASCVEWNIRIIVQFHRSERTK